MLWVEVMGRRVGGAEGEARRWGWGKAEGGKVNWCATASVCVRGGLLWFSPTIAQALDFFILIFNNDVEIYSQSFVQRVAATRRAWSTRPQRRSRCLTKATPREGAASNDKLVHALSTSPRIVVSISQQTRLLRGRDDGAHCGMPLR